MRLSALGGAFRAALDLVAPPRCLACSGDDALHAGLCRRCLALVGGPAADPCPRCAGPLGPGAPVGACQDCAALEPAFVAAVAAAPHGGLLGELVRRAKYGRDELLAVPLATLLAEAVAAWPPARSVACVVPAPTTARRRAEHGFHLAELLAESVARRLRVPALPRALVRTGDPPPQAALHRAERRLAARGTVEPPATRGVTRGLARLGLRVGADDALAGRRVLLVDDVLTTGATADACARALLRLGAADVVVAVASRA